MRTALSPRRGTAALAVAMAALLAGCVRISAPVIPPMGILYSDVSAPLLLPTEEIASTDLRSAEVYTEHFQIPISWLQLINLGWGDAALQTAIRQSGFREVLFADYNFRTILSVYSTFTVRVYGRR